MFRLISILYILIGTTLAGIGVTVVLSMNKFDSMSISVAALAGAVIAIPVSWIVGKQIYTALNNNRV